MDELYHSPEQNKCVHILISETTNAWFCFHIARYQMETYFVFRKNSPLFKTNGLLYLYGDIYRAQWETELVHSLLSCLQGKLTI